MDQRGFELFSLGWGCMVPKKISWLVWRPGGPTLRPSASSLLKRGNGVVQVSLFRAKQFRRAQGKKDKTDQVVARSLAVFLGMGTHKLLSLGYPLLENLRELTRFRAESLQDRTRQVKRLRNTLTNTFPELSNHLVVLNSPTAQALVMAGADALAALLVQKSHGRLQEPQAQAILASAHAPVVVLDFTSCSNRKVVIPSGSFSIFSLKGTSSISKS